MGAHTVTLIAAASRVSALGSDRTLGITVWIGLALLSLALIILMRTRWGQVKPLSKCIVLSVFAHFLLFMYAYGTRLLIPPPPGAGDQEAVQLTYLGDAAADGSVESTQSQPWEQFVAEQPAQFETEGPARDATDVEAVPRAEVANAWVDPTTMIVEEELPVAEVRRPTPLPPPPMPTKSHQTAVAPVAIEMPVKERQAAPTPMVPLPVAPVPRPGPVVADDPPQVNPRRAAQPELPTQLVDVGSRMQQLADFANMAETADARTGAEDRTAQSDNRDASLIESTGIAAIARRVTEETMGTLTSIPPAPRFRRSPPTSAADFVQQLVDHAAPRLADGQPIPKPYAARNAEQRAQWAQQQGGGEASEAAVDAALSWLAAHQEADGRWDADRWGAGFETQIAGHDRGGAGTNADTGITGLAVLAFLGNGQTHLEGRFRKNVQRGLEFLLRSQATDGNLCGQARLYASMYCHGMATLAMSEAYAMTGDVRIRPFVTKAVHYSVASQQPASGGWRYQPGDQGDMSQFGWQVMALKSAEMAGIPVPKSTRSPMVHFLNTCALGRHDGLACYQPGRPASRTMTAESLVCRYFLGIEPDDDLRNEATRYILAELPGSDRPNLYYWYYATMALYQVQGPAWDQWNQAMQRQLVGAQRRDGAFAGSWDPDTVWGSYGGRVYSTALATLCLEVYYRYLPLNCLDRFDTPEPVSTIK